MTSSGDSRRKQDLEILLVEDNVIAGMGLKAALVLKGYVVTGPIATVAEALVSVRGGDSEVAILDFRLRDRNALPVAQALSTKGIPFCFLTGYREIPELRSAFPRAQRFTKPAALEALIEFVEEATGS